MPSAPVERLAGVAGDSVAAHGSYELSVFQTVTATIAIVWYCIVVFVCGIGYTQLRRHYSRPPQPAKCISPSADPPHITIIRPIVGIEPNLYQCLASTFQQTYPREKLTSFLCIPSRRDPALPILERLLEDFPQHHAKILVEEEDPALQDETHRTRKLGPNPKIRNMSRAYREAEGELVWIVDCNVWIGKGVAGRMVDTLCGFGGKRPNKFVHQLPIVVDMPTSAVVAQTTISSRSTPSSFSDPTTRRVVDDDTTASILATSGGRLEELFMSSAHPKFYTAINTVLIAPCVVGKSSMFRRAHLTHLTRSIPNGTGLTGIDYFSYNICEDHLIGDLIWKHAVPASIAGPDPRPMGQHALLFGDLAIQPMARMSLAEYIARRVRWLRVRKYTVMLATFVEHGTESFAASAYGAYGLTTLPFFARRCRVPHTWFAFAIAWLVSVLLWAAVDWSLYVLLHSGRAVELDADTPVFVRPPEPGRRKRNFGEWLAAWLGREALAFPVWAWAVFGGATVVWRGKRFWVGLDMKVHEIGGVGDSGKTRTE